jgi:NTP pyrophosphatase (non-canonical NTP hydrolase)
MNPWRPMTNARDKKHIGKLMEELGECVAAAARCDIQGKSNRDWLEDEIADVVANIELATGHFRLDIEKMRARAEAKKAQLRIWHAME